MILKPWKNREVHGRYRHDRKSGRCGISDLRCRVNDCGIESVCDIMGSKEKQGTPKVAFVFPGPLTKVPPASAGSRVHERGGRE